MKQVSIIFFTLLACILGACSSDDDKGLEVADSYTPLIKEGKMWYYTVYSHSPYYPSAVEFFKGDTLIGGNAYHKLYRTDTSVPNRDMYRAAFREEGKKVYCVKDGSTVEVLAYDFGLSLGSSFTVMLAPTATQATVAAVTMDSNLNGSQQVQHCSQMTLTAKGVGSMLWVEGVGTLQGLVYDFRNRSGLGGGEMLYLCSDLSTGQVFYQRR